ncbi:uncharacterized protein LOC117175216 [Belonocnema kinseyi]|uniref:uncharacterized protein LOC117175216 n=1 Tax=Belonocnema kinseyi TaxID=2817044 RepID=UPI00143CD9AA|nr:uncharacterized protein LOC117175216 [Belonocnema kinseyi]
MKTANGIVCFFLLILIKPIELTWPLGGVPVHPTPIRLYIFNFGSIHNPDRAFHLRRGFHSVVIDEDYQFIIGIIIYGDFCPLLIPKLDRPPDYNQMDVRNYLKVKVRVNGNIANVTVPISDEDPLNERFGKPVRSKYIIRAEIPR